MKIRITVHPIDVALQKELEIYAHSKVPSAKVGRVISKLADAGYTNVQAHVMTDWDVMGEAYADGRQCLSMHIQKDVTKG